MKEQTDKVSLEDVSGNFYILKLDENVTSITFEKLSGPKNSDLTTSGPCPACPSCHADLQIQADNPNYPCFDHDGRSSYQDWIHPHNYTIGIRFGAEQIKGIYYMIKVGRVFEGKENWTEYINIKEKSALELKEIWS